jgi:hypothetical protein
VAFFNQLPFKSSNMSAFNTPWFNSQERNFFDVLNKTKIPNVVLCAETEDFDEELMKQWVDEGFRCAYVPLLNGGAAFISRVHKVGDGFGVSEQYAIVCMCIIIIIIIIITTATSFT